MSSWYWFGSSHTLNVLVSPGKLGFGSGPDLLDYNDYLMLFQHTHTHTYTNTLGLNENTNISSIVGGIRIIIIIYIICTDIYALFPVIAALYMY